MLSKKTTIWAVIGIIIGVAVIFLSAKNPISLKTNQNSGSEKSKIQENPISGTSGVNEKGAVVTPEGVPTKNNVNPGSPEAPQQSNPISESEIPKSAIKLKMSRAGIEPNSFSVRAGEAVTLSVTAADSMTHVFAFKEETLLAVAVGLAGGETRAITFNAPAKGEYNFYCNVPGHRSENGKMIVR